jgi:DNA-binding XRE family transcriptional regulator
MPVELRVKLCRYINENFRPKYKSNRDFAKACGINEATLRLIGKEQYNPSLELFQSICDSQEVKMSTVLAAIGE